MFCHNCGRKLPNQAHFCPSCGTVVPEDACTEQTVPAPQSAPPPPSKAGLFKNKSKAPKAKKPPKSGKKLLRFAAAAAAAVAVIALVWWLLSRPPVISIPDPAHFFGISAQEEEGYHLIAHEFTFNSNTDQQARDKADAYVELLDSSKYPYVLKDSYESTVLSWTNYIYELDYTGSDKVKSKDAPCDVRIRYEPGNSTNNGVPALYIWFYDHYKYEFTPAETYAAPASSPEAPAPEESTAPSAPADVSQAPAQTEPAAAPSAPAEPVLAPSAPATVTVQKAPTDLPDPGPFLGGLNRNEDQDSYGGHLVSYKFDLDEGRDPAEEYRQLLERWGNLELDWVGEPFSWEGRTYTSYFYKYVGEGDVTAIEVIDDISDVQLSISYYADRGYILLTLYYAPEMNVIDSGEKASSFPEDFVGSSSGTSSGGSSSSGSSFSSTSSSRNNSSPKTDCYKCRGDGDITCSRCNGAGGKEKRESVPNYSGSLSGPKYATTWETCSKCRGTGEMTCTACNGSGTN